MKVMESVMVGAAFALLAGCATSSGRVDGFVTLGNCTDSFMDAPVERTFPLPREKAPSLARDRTKLVGRWRKDVVFDTKTSVKANKIVQQYRMSYAEVFELKGDGTYTKTDSMKERAGTWFYSGNSLVLQGPGGESRYRLTWYGDGEFLARLEDPMKGMENGLNAKRWYDDDGCLRMRLELDDAINQTVMAPEVFVRIPDVAK